MVAVVPSPPLLVPQLVAGRAAETAELRSACLRAASRLADAADRWIVVAADPGGRRTLAQPVGGTFVGYGVDVPVALAPGAPVEPDLPLPLLIAGWLRGEVAGHVVAAAELVPPDLSAEDCRAIGAELAGGAGSAGLLVVGDGAITHTQKAPGYLDRRAGPFDDRVADALAAADPHALLALDVRLATELGAAGRAPWQVLAGAALALGGEWHGERLYSAAPYGVAYHVAVWRR